MLLLLFLIWAVACVGLAATLVGHAPAVSMALIGSTIGAVAGFFVGNADGPAEVPAYTAVGASAGLMVAGVIGLAIAPGRPPQRYLRTAAVIVLAVAPFAAAALAILLQVACPLYVNGKDSGFCNYQNYDLLGGWVSGVVTAFVFDSLVVTLLLFLSARQAGVRNGSRSPERS